MKVNIYKISLILLLWVIYSCSTTTQDKRPSLQKGQAQSSSSKHYLSDPSKMKKSDEAWLDYVPERLLGEDGYMNGKDCTGLNPGKSKKIRNRIKHMIWDKPDRPQVKWIWGSQAALSGCQGMSHVGKAKFLRKDLLKYLPIILEEAYKYTNPVTITTTTTRFHSYSNSKHYQGGAIDIAMTSASARKKVGQAIKNRIAEKYGQDAAEKCQFIANGRGHRDHLHFQCK